MQHLDLILPVAALITGLTVVFTAIRKTGSFFRRMVHLFDEILGQESHDGLPATPGLSARISAIEAELRPNGGSSLRDQINRLEAWNSQHSHIHDDIAKNYSSHSN